VCQATPKHFENCLHFGDIRVIIICQNRERRLFCIVHGAVLKHNNEKCKPILPVLLLDNHQSHLSVRVLHFPKKMGWCYCLSHSIPPTDCNPYTGPFKDLLPSLLTERAMCG
jgi:hypothetical protein